MAIPAHRDVAGDLEVPEGAAALGVGLALGDPLAVEVGHLLDQIVILQQDRAVWPHGERMLIALDQRARIGSGRKLVLVLSHADTSSVASLLPAMYGGRRERPADCGGLDDQPSHVVLEPAGRETAG
jgi:hypothetical protein